MHTRFLYSQVDPGHIKPDESAFHMILSELQHLVPYARTCNRSLAGRTTHWEQRDKACAGRLELERKRKEATEKEDEDGGGKKPVSEEACPEPHCTVA
jgi:hypothetical protein